MAIPVHLQQFKAAGIYRVVFDKSTIKGVDSEILRLVVGYSEVGPFNIPTYVKSASEFKAIYGDISKKLERRGVFFHRIALHALQAGPILCLNLKKFNGETVGGATINTDFNPNYSIIDTVKINVEDIYDTSRFWELSAEKLINLKSADNVIMDQYINIAATNTKNTSASFFIRKANGTKMNAYNITVSDWYSDKAEEMPEYLQNFKYNLISDFFAEIYVFSGHFTSDQVLASSTLKNYFELARDAEGNLIDEEKVKVAGDAKPGLQLRKYVLNAYGEPVDSLDALYNDPTSNPIGHYIGCLIPNFKNKKGQYMSLDLLFNEDQDIHNMMMSFNVDALDEGLVNIDLSGRFAISTNASNSLTIEKLFNGTATSKLLSNDNSKVIVDIPTIMNNIVKVDDDGSVVPVNPLIESSRRISGALYVSEKPNFETGTIKLKQIGDDTEIVISGFTASTEENPDPDFLSALIKLHVAVKVEDGYEIENGKGTFFNTKAYIEDGKFITDGPEEIITSISRIDQDTTSENPLYRDSDKNMSVSITNVMPTTISTTNVLNVYGSSVDFINMDEGWSIPGYEGAEPTQLVTKDETIQGQWYIIATNIWNNNLATILAPGDCLLADDASTDRDEDSNVDIADGFYDNVYVQSIEKLDVVEDNKEYSKYVIKLSGKPFVYEKDDNQYLIKIASPLNQEVGCMMPTYLEGYTYLNSKPEGTDMMSKLNWQKFILSALTEYKGLRTGLVNKSNIDYRYIIDSFESYVDSGLKNVLSALAKEKQSAFAILNFPSIKTFVKCPYSAYTDNKGVFNVDYIVKGFNKKKPSGVKFTLPDESDGASFCAFYTPLKFSDGYIDMIIPSAGLVSNLFMEKYNSRQPYYIIAGPNYGLIRHSELVGPDYNYSQDELQIIEPFGVNCMIYRPGFGTFINANQTAKQTPVSALSKVNIRELVIYIQDEIEKVLQAYQWEFNNARTRAAIKDRADQICARVAANGGIQKFLNVMDESNNTPEIIDNEMAVLSTHIEPGFGCGKMVQELTLYRTGQMSSSISD